PAALRRGEPLSATTAWGRALTAEGRDALAGLRAGGRPRRLADLLHDGPRAEDALDSLDPGWRAAPRSLEARVRLERVRLDDPAGSRTCSTTGPGPKTRSTRWIRDGGPPRAASRRAACSSGCAWTTPRRVPRRPRVPNRPPTRPRPWRRSVASRASPPSCWKA